MQFHEIFWRMGVLKLAYYWEIFTYKYLVITHLSYTISWRFPPTFFPGNISSAIHFGCFFGGHHQLFVSFISFANYPIFVFVTTRASWSRSCQCQDPNDQNTIWFERRSCRIHIQWHFRCSDYLETDYWVHWSSLGGKAQNSNIVKKCNWFLAKKD